MNAPSHINNLVSKPDKDIYEFIKAELGENCHAFQVDLSVNEIKGSWCEQYQEFGGRIIGILNNGAEIDLFNETKSGLNAQFDLFEEVDLNVFVFPSCTKGCLLCLW
jgi:hypothetical protein